MTLLPARTVVLLLLCLLSLPVLLHLVLFSVSIDTAFEYLVDHIYPYPQQRQPLRLHPILIYAHIYCNGIALLIGSLQILYTSRQWIRSHPTLHSVLGYAYVACLTAGSAAAVLYARHQQYGGDRDGGFAGQLSFAFCLPAWTGLVYQLCWNDSRTHSEWMQRSFACLFGSFFIFRLLARVYLPLCPDRYSAWLPMVFMSWIIPLWATEQYIAFRTSQSRRREEQQSKSSKAV
jgi:hypothetical protein